MQLLAFTFEEGLKSLRTASLLVLSESFRMLFELLEPTL
jgi:hypothetical protein